VRSALTMCLIAGLMVQAHAQRGFSTGNSSGNSGSRPVTPSVVSALWSHEDDEHVSVLEFLVLLRGTPGWFAASGAGTNGFEASTGNGHSAGHTYATSGGITVAVDSDSSVATRKLTVLSKLVTIFDRQIAEGEVNVVLVDGVGDAAAGPPRVETRWIAPRLVGEGDVLAKVIRSSSELREFLRCDTPFPSGVPNAPAPVLLLMQTRTFTLCNEVRGR
jgi:hypothetical protein